MGGARQSEKEEVISMSKKRSSNADIKKQVEKSKTTNENAGKAVGAEKKSRRR